MVGLVRFLRTVDLCLNFVGADALIGPLGPGFTKMAAGAVPHLHMGSLANAPGAYAVGPVRDRPLRKRRDCFQIRRRGGSKTRPFRDSNMFL